MSEARWAGIERALRAQMIKDGFLADDGLENEELSSHLAAEANGMCTHRLAFLCEFATRSQHLSINRLCVYADEFSRTFTESALGIALNVDSKGRILVKRCANGSASASRRIPPGVVLARVNGQETAACSLHDVQTMIKEAERPVRLDFHHTDASLALVTDARRKAKSEADDKKVAVQAEKERIAKAAAEALLMPLEAAPTFSRTFADSRLGLALADDDAGRTIVRSCLPGSVARRAGVPPGAVVIAINGTSVQFQKMKKVKKLIELAARPVTIDFSTEEEPVFPMKASSHLGGATVPEATAADARVAMPAYAFKPA